jgi:hypothetical protein
MVLKPIQPIHHAESVPEHFSDTKVVEYLAALFVEKAEEGCGKAIARESRAHRLM